MALKAYLSTAADASRARMLQMVKDARPEKSDMTVRMFFGRESPVQFASLDFMELFDEEAKVVTKTMMQNHLAANVLVVPAFSLSKASNPQEEQECRETFIVLDSLTPQKLTFHCVSAMWDFHVGFFVESAEDKRLELNLNALVPLVMKANAILDDFFQNECARKE